MSKIKTGASSETELAMGLPKLKAEPLSPEDEFFDAFRPATPKSGVQCLMTLNKQREVKNYFTKDIRSAKISKLDNVYFTVNTFKKHLRRKSQICALNAFYVDLDVYKKGYSKEQVLFALPTILDDLGLFKPTAVVDSGNGLYLFWKIDEVIVNDESILKLYERVNKQIQRLLADYGADPAAVDATRVLRIPGSYNRKYKAVNRVEVLQVDASATYDLQSFVDELLPAYKRKLKKYPARKTTTKKKKMAYLFNPFTLNKARINDIEKLVQMRVDANGKLEGSRNILIFLYVNFCIEAKIPDIYQKVYDLNDTFIDPLNVKEVDLILKRLQNRDETYRFKNETLVDWLDLKEDEAELLQTIISKSEKQRRNTKARAKRYKPVKEANRQKKVERDEQIHKLYAEGSKITHIASQLNVHRNTVSNVLNAVKEPK